jgi:hypothetical protein
MLGDERIEDAAFRSTVIVAMKVAVKQVRRYIALCEQLLRLCW